MGNITANSNSSVSRNQLQGQIMTCVYQYLFYLKFEEKPDLINIICDVFEMPVENVDPYAKKAVLECVKNMQEAVDAITPCLNKFTFERLSLVEQAILALAYVENHYLKQPKAVAINVAVKLAQKYSDAESYKYINGVLEQVCHD